MVSCKLTKTELRLITATRWIRFGEIHKATILEDEDRNNELTLFQEEKQLIDVIRDGTLYFKSIKIYNGKPVFAETTGEKNGFQYTKQFKLNN